MAEHQIQRNRRTGEYRHLTERGWEPYTPSMPEGAPERYLPGLADTPTTAAVNELLRTGKEAGIGLARSPLDALKGLFRLVTSPVESAKGLASAVADPNATLQAIADNPRDAGSLLGQLLLGKVGVPRIPSMAANVPGAMSAAGRGAEMAGATLEGIKVGGVPLTGLGAAGAAFQGNWPLVAAAAAPTAVKYAGKGLQQVGGGLERLKESLTPRASVETPQALLRPPRVSTEVPYRADIPESPGPAASVPGRDNYSDVFGARRIPPSDNPLLDVLEPLPEGSAWSALRTMRTRPEPEIMPELPAYRHPILREPPTNLNQVLSLADEGDVRLPIPEVDPLSRLDALRARQMERYGRTQPFRSETTITPSMLPAAWQPFTEHPVTQDLRSILEELRKRLTPGLTNPSGR